MSEAGLGWSRHSQAVGRCAVQKVRGRSGPTPVVFFGILCPLFLVFRRPRSFLNQGQKKGIDTFDLILNVIRVQQLPFAGIFLLQDHRLLNLIVDMSTSL